jgi:hypothetical protein
MLALLAGVARRGEQRRAGDADDDREHRDVLVAPRALAEYALAEHQQHEQADRQRRLHHHQRSQ